MAKLIYTTITSLDLFVNDAHGNSQWAAPDQDVHAVISDLQRDVGTHLYGRRIYEAMRFWATVADGNADIIGRSYARLWRRADKVVYSRTLTEVDAERTRIEPHFDPVEVRAYVDAAADDVAVGGPTLAAAALTAGIVDEVHLFMHPVFVGGGMRAFPEGVTTRFELVDEERFPSGVVYLHYRVVQ